MGLGRVGIGGDGVAKAGGRFGSPLGVVQGRAQVVVRGRVGRRNCTARRSTVIDSSWRPARHRPRPSDLRTRRGWGTRPAHGQSAPPRRPACRSAGTARRTSARRRHGPARPPESRGRVARLRRRDPPGGAPARRQVVRQGCSQMFPETTANQSCRDQDSISRFARAPPRAKKATACGGRRLFLPTRGGRVGELIGQRAEGLDPRPWRVPGGRATNVPTTACGGQGVKTMPGPSTGRKTSQVPIRREEPGIARTH